MAESMDIQSFERMKIYANKLMDRLKDRPDDPKAEKWGVKLQQALRNMKVVEHEVAIAVLKEDPKVGDVRIEVPIKHFATKAHTPGA